MNSPEDEKNICQNHPEGGKRHIHAFCYCDLRQARSQVLEEIAQTLESERYIGHELFALKLAKEIREKASIRSAGQR